MKRTVVTETRRKANAPPPSPENEPIRELAAEDQDAVVCLFLELFDAANYVAGNLGTTHWTDGLHLTLKTELRGTWGQRGPDKSFAAAFSRGALLLEVAFPNEVRRLRESGLTLTECTYGEDPAFPNTDDLDDIRTGRYDDKALAALFMELFSAYSQMTGHRDHTHWRGVCVELKRGMDGAWAERWTPKFAEYGRTGARIVEESFPRVFQLLRRHGVVYEARLDCGRPVAEDAA